MRVLVVEDEMTIAMMVEDMLIDLGHEVVDLAMRLPRALELAEVADFDFAVLDLNLDGHKSFPVAEILAKRRIPFVFATGYGRSGVEPPFLDYPVLTKPFTIDELAGAIPETVKVPASSA
jgi:CheY-like chemotaxis protein